MPRSNSSPTRNATSVTPNPKRAKWPFHLIRPEDWPRVFEQHLNVGDLDAMMALYEPEARFVSRSGETLVIPPSLPQLRCAAWALRREGSGSKFLAV